MGGDLGVNITIPGAALALKEHSDIHFLIFGDEARIRPILSRYPDLRDSSEVIHTDKFISNTPSTNNTKKNRKTTNSLKDIKITNNFLRINIYLFLRKINKINN